MKQISFLLLLVSVPAVLFAQEKPSDIYPSFYLSVNIGYGGLSGMSSGGNYVFGPQKSRHVSTEGPVFGGDIGWQFNPYFGIEADSYTYPMVTDKYGDESLDWLTGTMAKFTDPITPDVSLFFKAGVASMFNEWLSAYTRQAPYFAIGVSTGSSPKGRLQIMLQGIPNFNKKLGAYALTLGYYF